MVKQLILNGTDINAKNKRGHTPLISAALSGNLKASKSKYKIIYPFFFSGNTKIVEILITNGADVNGNSSDGWSPLHFAARFGNFGNLEKRFTI